LQTQNGTCEVPFLIQHLMLYFVRSVVDRIFEVHPESLM
jgi:hypothetical protein